MFDKFKLEQLIIDATKRSWNSFLAECEGKGIYAFALYTCDEGLYVFATCNTLPSLMMSAKSKGLDSDAIKWSPCDWSYHGRYESFYSEVDDFLSTGWSEDYSEFKYDSAEIKACCLSALRKFVYSNEFASYRNNSNVFVGLLMGDQSSENINEFAVNMPKGCDICA